MKTPLLYLYLLLSISKSFAQYDSPKKLDSLIKVAYDIKKVEPEKTIAISLKTLASAKKINYADGKIKSLDNIAFSYYTLGQNEKAISYAVEQENEALNANDYIYACYGARVKALAYSKLGFYNEADKIVNSTFLLSDKITDNDDRHKVKGILYATKVAICLNDNPDSRDASLLKNNKKSVEEFIQIKSAEKREKLLSNAYSNVGTGYSDLKKYDSAFYYLNKSLVLARKVKDLRSEYSILNGLGMINYDQKKYQTAVVFFESSVKKAKEYNDPYGVRTMYLNLDSCYIQLNDTKKALEYATKYIKLNDSIVAAEKLAFKAPVKQIIKEKEARFSKIKNNLYLIIIISTILFIIALFIAIRFLKNYKKEKTAKLEKEVTIIERNKKVAELETKVNDGFEEVLELAKKDDASFLTRFKEVYPEFYNRLTINESLTPGDLKFCALLKLNFSSKEIAYYTHASIRTVESRKHRIRKKLNIPSSEDLNLWMMAY